jgi:hypothetical protein
MLSVKTKKGTKYSKDKLREVVGACVHPDPEHVHEVTREKAFRKCLKQYNNKCQYFMPKEMRA